MAYVNTAINPSPTIVAKTAAELAAPAMLAIKYNGAGMFEVAGAGSAAVGICVADAGAPVRAGQDVSVVVKDITLWKSGGAFVPGDELTPDANGAAVKANAGDFILGFAMQQSFDAGEIVSAQITKSGYKA